MIREYRDTDYPMLCEWWNAQKFPPPPENVLPGTGYVYKESAAGFLYITNSAISWMEFVVLNPATPKPERKDAVNLLIAHICKHAAFAGAKMVFTSSNFWPFIQRLQSQGFEIGDTNTTQLIKRVG